MKKTLFLLLVLITISNTKCFAQYTSNIWTKIDIKTTENLQKVIIVDTKTLIFSNNNCYIGKNLSDWEKVSIPGSYNICPVIFQESIYINCKDGIYKSLDGKKWEKTSSESALSLAANNKKMFAFTSDPYRVALESEDGVNFKEIAGVQNLYPTWEHGGYDYNPNFTFAEAFGDTIYASGLTNMGPSERTCQSFDNGITWTDGIDYERITDIDLIWGKLSMTTIDHSGLYFIVYGPYEEFMMRGGTFSTLKSFGDPNTIYCGGRTYNNGIVGGIIMEYFNIGNIFYPPEQINRLESNEYYIIAVGEKGAVYVIKNDFTDYLLSANPLTVIQSDEVGKEKIGIFPNPASNILNIMAAPGGTIKVIDLNGRIVKSLLATEEKSVINISDLTSGVYIVRTGNRATKFIKR